MSHPEITSNDIPSVLERNLKAGNRKPPLLLAYYGLGKSMQGNKFAKNNGMHYIDYRAAYKTFNDVRGFGVPNRESGKMEFLIDEDFDFVDDKPNCLHFEEILNASQQTQKPLMQAMLDRRIGKFKFPADTFIFGSSNRLSQKTGVERLLAALADRFAIFHVRPDIDSYKGYLEQNGKAPEVLAFLSANPNATYDFDIKKWDGESNLPTFRSFDRLDDLTASYTNIREAADDPLFRANAASCVGAKYGEMFAQFIKLASRIGDVRDMIDNADTCKIPSEPDIKWLVACRAITEANKDNLPNVLTLAHRLSDPDQQTPDALLSMESFVGNSIRRRKQDLLSVPAMLNWQLKHADALTQC